jgi:YegS/Rv2252/BmrU family lipid kinase
MATTTHFPTTLIVNPQARGGWPRRKWPRLEPMLRATLGPLEVRFTEKPGDGRRLAREAIKSGSKLVVALGGDGTASEVAGGLLEHQDSTHETEPVCSFGYLPCATGGDLRRTLGTPDSLEEAARAIVNSKGRLIDAGRLDYTGHDGKPARGYFLNVASAGIGGLVDKYANESSKMLGGKVTFFLASLRATMNYKNAAVRVQLDDRPAREHKIYLLAVGNGRYFGGGMHAAPTAAIDDGLLEVVLFGDMSFTEALQLSKYIYKGEHLSLPKVSCTRARSITVEPCDPSERVLLDVDGEVPGRLPATFTVMPRAILLRG